MFYEISLKEVNFIPYLELSKLGDFILVYQTAVLFSDKNKNEIIKELKKCVSESDQFMVSELNNEDFLRMPENISVWIKQKGIQEDIKKYEEENQKILKGTLDYIEELDRKWGDELREQKKQNENDGPSKPKNKPKNKPRIIEN